MAHSEVSGFVSPAGSIAAVAARLSLWARRSGNGFAQVEYSSEFSRQQVVERVEAELPGTLMESIALLRQGSAADVLRDLGDRLAQVPAGAVVWVTGFAGAFEQVDGLRILNFNREMLAAFPLRQVWWVTPVVGQMLLQATPDLQGWFNPKLRLTESIVMAQDGLIQERSGSRQSLVDAMDRSQRLVAKFEQVRQTDISDQEALKTYLLPALEALAEVGAEEQLRDLTLQFEGFLSPIKDGDPLDVAASLSRLGTLYYKQGRYSRAEPLIKQALAIRKAQLGDRHLQTAASLNNLAELYRSTGRYDVAEPLLLEALEIKKSQLGDQHPSTATSLNNLAELYKSMSRYDAAEPLHLKALEISKSQLGDRHPDTAGSLNNLAALYQSLGRYDAAEPLLLEALEISKAQLGDRHPDTATSLNNLAVFYANTKQYDRALPLLEAALSIRQELLPAGHPDILSTQQSLEILRGWMGEGN